jgi:hypothetical protein
MFRHGPSSLTGPVSRKAWSGEPPPTRPEAERPFRADLVERVRREIAEGIYDTPEKFDIALERLMRRLEGED